jgi:predicted adenylyl cyclase CyaB
VPTNIEIKARVRDPRVLESVARSLSDMPPVVLRQRDTFFACRDGRLKLREFGCGKSELIWYRRIDSPGSKRSDYQITPVSEPEKLRAVLAGAYGTTQVVEKIRTLLHVGQARIHLDDVVGLGTFIELEVVLRDGQPEQDGHAIAADLMERIGIDPSDLVDRAYADLLR